MDVKNIVDLMDSDAEFEIDLEVLESKESEENREEVQTPRIRPPKPYSLELYIELQEEWGTCLPEALFKPSFEDEIISKMDHQSDYKFLHDALKKLSKKQQKRIYLRFFLDLTISKISEIEKCEISNVKRAIQLGLQNLTKLLEKFNS